jgi:hypothetical protein
VLKPRVIFLQQQKLLILAEKEKKFPINNEIFKKIFTEFRKLLLKTKKKKSAIQFLIMPDFKNIKNTEI